MESQNRDIIIKINKSWINPLTIGIVGTLLFFGLFLVTKREGGLDREQVAAQVQQELEKEANIKLKSVSCPEGIPMLANVAFECQGEISPEKKFPITVKQKDDAGNVEWDVANSPVMLNLKELASEFEDAIASQSGKHAIVTCSGTYRLAKSGDTFDCAVQGGQGDKLTVKIDSTGSVAWQQVLPPAPVAVASTPTPTPATPTTTPTTATPEAKTADTATPVTAKEVKPEAKTAADTETGTPPDPTQDKNTPPGEQLDDPYNWD